MELGNLCFGNSRGNFPVDRDGGYWSALVRLIYAYSRQEYDGHCIPEYENEVFHIFPYYWGDCDCGFEQEENKIYNKVDHRPDCYQIEVYNEKLLSGFTEDNYGLLSHPDGYDKREELEDKIYKKWCKKFGLSFEFGRAVHCTCDYNKRIGQKFKQSFYPIGHRSWCKVLIPNFLYKPTGFSIKWYKYPFRDSYMSQNLSDKEFSKIVNKCIESLK